MFNSIIQYHINFSGIMRSMVSAKALHEGSVLKAWWVGLRPSLARTIPGVACYFATLSQVLYLTANWLFKAYFASDILSR